MNKYPSLTKDQAEKVVAHFQAYINMHLFSFPGIEPKLQVSYISIAPYPEYPYSVFKDNFSYMFGTEKAMEHYRNNLFRVVVLAEIYDTTKANIAHPYFFDVFELIDKGLKEFSFPQSILDIET